MAKGIPALSFAGSTIDPKSLIVIAPIASGSSTTDPTANTYNDAECAFVADVLGAGIWNPCVSLYDRKPDAGEILFDITLAFAAVLPAGLTGSAGGINSSMNGAAAATSNAMFNLYKNGTLIGTATIPASTTGRSIATFSFTGAISFAAGDSFQFRAPTAQDATLQGFSFSFLGSR